MAIINKVICDVCGVDCKEYGNEHARLSTDWSYGSPYDGEYHELIVCPKCYEVLVKNVRDKIWVYDINGKKWQGLDDIDNFFS